MENSQSNPRVQDAHVWYDEKLKSHFLFCSIDGKEREGKRISPLDAAKLRDGVMTIDSLVDKHYPWLKEGKSVEEDASVHQTAGLEPENRSAGQRFRSNMNDLGENAYNNGIKFTSWVTDVMTLAWNDDNIGAYKEFAKGVDFAERQVTNAVEFLRLDAAVDKARTYLLSLYDAGGQVLRADFGKAREAARPIASDLRSLGNFVFIRSGVWPMVKNLTERTLDFGRAVFSGNRKEAVQTGKVILGETGKDMKTILHSESAQKTVEGVLTGMERLHKATKVSDEQQQVLNRKREDDLDIKHPRLSQVRIYANSSGMDHFIRCCIDGVQQMGHPLKEQDYTSWQLGTLDRYQLAEKYYANDLQADLSRSAGLAR